MQMAEVKLLFYQSLNDFVKWALRNTEICHYHGRKASIKDMIESFNVPAHGSGTDPGQRSCS